MINTKTLKLTQTGLFMTLTVLLSYVFAIHTTFVHVTFGFLSTAIFAILYGPWRAGIMAMLAAFIGMLLFGRGVFFPGFMLSAFLVGITYGYFLHNKPVTLRRICIPELIITVFIHLGLNTFWLTIFYDKAASAIFMSRLIKNIICFPMEVLLIYLVYRAMATYIPTLQIKK